jgi:CubicO group peptidase (beta-lactamase class C family)
MSAGKSITSACISIAIEEGFIESVEQSIFEYLPDYQHLATDGKDEITIEHLLTMTAGLEWDEWSASNSDINNDLIRLWVDCDDQVACVLERPLINEPGTNFTYSGGGMIVLGEIIANATGMDIEAFASKYLFAPLGIDSVVWTRFDSGVIYAGGEQMLSSREMLKFGITYLNNGRWNGEQVIPEEWASLSAVPYGNNSGIRVPGSDGGRKGYSYSWWTWETKHNGQLLKTYYAGGWGGQRIFVIPELDTVVIMTGGNYTSKTHTFEIMEKYVLPAFN